MWPGSRGTARYETAPVVRPEVGPVVTTAKRRRARSLPWYQRRRHGWPAERPAPLRARTDTIHPGDFRSSDNLRTRAAARPGSGFSRAYGRLRFTHIGALLAHRGTIA